MEQGAQVTCPLLVVVFALLPRAAKHCAETLICVQNCVLVNSDVL